MGSLGLNIGLRALMTSQSALETIGQLEREQGRLTLDKRRFRANIYLNPALGRV